MIAAAPKPVVAMRLRAAQGNATGLRLLRCQKQWITYRVQSAESVTSLADVARQATSAFVSDSAGIRPQHHHSEVLFDVENNASPDLLRGQTACSMITSSLWLDIVRLILRK